MMKDSNRERQQKEPGVDHSCTFFLSVAYNDRHRIVIKTGGRFGVSITDKNLRQVQRQEKLSSSTSSSSQFCQCLLRNADHEEPRKRVVIFRSKKDTPVALIHDRLQCWPILEQYQKADS
ncbi:hypothetical protein CEXT_344921 [Caerostris extrusa]|uniref:Uncharacterized protein n=1 Tax=Caerostris extrusa TaxID=172846 RepID=A0AAV4UEY8_CAEEX|nr:hypothetical protein CEXT_344921 [Caerostris extrusa]